MVKSPVVSGSWVVRAAMLVASALVCCAAALCLARPAVAVADEAAGVGYVTVSGAEGVDAAAQFATLDEAAAALAGASSLAQDATSASLVVHGTVDLDGPLALTAPSGAQGIGVVGNDASAVVRTSADGAASLSATAGSLVVRGVSFSGPVSLSSIANLSVEGCSFSSALSTSAPGAVSVCGNTFSSAVGDARALTATLSADGATLTFNGNVISGYGTGLSVTLADGVARPAVSVTGNTFTLGGAYSVQPVLCLAGGLWTPSSVTFDGNTIESATVLVELESSFGVESPQAAGGADPSVTRSLTLAGGALDAPGVAGVFELMGRGSGTSSQSAQALMAAPALTDANPAAVDVANQAAALLFPNEHAASDTAAVAPGSDAALLSVDATDGAMAADATLATSQTVEVAPPAASGSGTYTISYDANGASAGLPPESTSVAAGSNASVAAAGSLVNAGFEFRGWNTAADGSGTFYAVGQVFVPSSDVTLYAQWTPTGTVATVVVTTVTAGA